MSRRTDPERVERAVEKYIAGLTAPIAAKQTGIGESVLYRALQARGIQPRELMRRGLRGKANRRFSDGQELIIAGEYEAGASLAQLGTRWHVCLVTIRNALRRQGVERRRQGASRRAFRPDQIAEMAQRWDAGESQAAIARGFSADQRTVSHSLEAYGYRMENRPARGSRHGLWKGGHLVMGGYRYALLAPDSPFAAMRQSQGYVMEHRLVMALSLGRPLLASETVHHINGEPLDNRIENLQLRDRKHGAGVTYRCADCGSTNVLPERLR